MGEKGGTSVAVGREERGKGRGSAQRTLKRSASRKGVAG